MRRLFLLAWGWSVVLGFASLRGDDAPPDASAPKPPPMPSVDYGKLPWVNGESLTYLVSWEAVEAAQGTFTARWLGDHWKFELALGSRGVVDTIYPFTGIFWSVLARGPWRSIEYGEKRVEPKRTIDEKTLIDYAKQKGTQTEFVKKKSKTFTIDQASLDDVGTMLYRLRAAPWKVGDKRTLYVYESGAEKQGEVQCEARETRAFGTWPAQPMLRLSALPTVGTKHKGHLTLWMTDDARRLPLHAELDFRYGTFEMDLTGSSKVKPAGP